ncbi:MAG: hypothetical protein M5U08_00905 [Burkholderiales bacterium]|nr:hypothetical protein [Burkholderiales bacterium]
MKSNTLAPLSTPSIALHEPTNSVHLAPYKRSASLQEMSRRRSLSRRPRRELVGNPALLDAERAQPIRHPARAVADVDRPLGDRCGWLRQQRFGHVAGQVVDPGGAGQLGRGIDFLDLRRRHAREQDVDAEEAQHLVHPVDHPVLVLDECDLQAREVAYPLAGGVADVVVDVIPERGRVVDRDGVEPLERDPARKLADERQLKDVVLREAAESVQMIRDGRCVSAPGGAVAEQEDVQRPFDAHAFAPMWRRLLPRCYVDVEPDHPSDRR